MRPSSLAMELTTATMNIDGEVKIRMALTNKTLRIDLVYTYGVYVRRSIIQSICIG